MESSNLLFAALSVISLLLWWRPLWSGRHVLALLLIPVECFIALSFVYAQPGVGSAIFASISLYKIVNYVRIIRGRIHVDHLKRASFRGALLLSLAQLITAGIVSIGYDAGQWQHNAAYGWALAQLIVALIIFSSTQRHLQTTKTLQATTAYTDAELPSVSVLIPARNETDDLHACLEALVASDYPKLEIIVLDDCSQLKRTPEIIRSFAQSGVRFLAGKAPSESWLAKNFAYQQLADAANGDLLLFCGVDLRMTPGAIRELVTTMLEKQKTMISILPHNDRPKELRTMLVQPLRYAWELSLPRRLFNRPPVLSTCWMIKRDALQSSGSFKATSRSIVPESHFARFTARIDGYSFLRSNLLVSSKPASEQQATAIRMRYPQLHRRIELVWLVTLIELLCIAAPLPLAVLAIVQGAWLIALLAGAAYLLLILVFFDVSGIMYGRPLVIGFAIVPLTALYDVFLLHLSAYRYEFGEVQWKERNICLPIMRAEAIASLPPVGSARKS
ncbi:MAG TPA: glycosyltransferase family 2 protein [Candidatus Saccharimonadales bacterium]